MALYCLTYDLRKTRNYQTLYDELTQFKAVRVLESVWFFHRQNTDAMNLCKHYMRFTDKDDGLVVIEVSDWATFKVDNPVPK